MLFNWIAKLEWGGGGGEKLYVLASSQCLVKSHSSRGAGRLCLYQELTQSPVKQPAHCVDAGTVAVLRTAEVKWPVS